MYTIGGTNYCGSTLLSLILGSHPEVFAAGEVHRVPSGHGCAVHGGACDFWTASRRARCADGWTCYSVLRADLEAEVAPRVILYSTKLPALIRTYLELGNEVDGMVVLFKRPEGYCFSSIAHERVTVPQACHEYAETHEQLLGLVDAYGIGALFQSYESLARDPTAVVPRICRFLGIDFRKDMLASSSVQQPHLVGGNAGTYASSRDIRCDERWRTLDEGRLAQIAGNGRSSAVFRELERRQA